MMTEMKREFESIELLEDLRNEIERRLGSLRAAQGTKTLNLPLHSVDVNARAVGRVVEVTISQVFRNPYKEHLEAEYIFPMSGCASVNSFKMHVGGRTVIGTIQERQAARAQYQNALVDGKRASLLEQERDDVFTMQVGNIAPDERVTVEITYTERLEFFEDGTTELRLPLVVAPRHIPGTALAREQVGDGTALDTDEVPDASRISPPRLASGVDPDVSLTIEVELIPEHLSDRDGQLSRISDLSCSQHAVRTTTTDGAIRITLAKVNELLDRDFVLKWKLVSNKVTSSVVFYKKFGKLQRDPDGYAMLSLVPPSSGNVSRMARDVVFVLDRSGSMRGQKMVSAARACAILLSTLGPGDRFAINAFDDRCEWYRRQGNFYDADSSGIENGIAFLRGIEARGGTLLNTAVSDALTLTKMHIEKNRVPVIVVLTDGEVGNEGQILKMVQQSAGDTRIFTIGIDTAVNSSLLKRLAALAGGTSAFVTPGSQLEDALVNIGREIGQPLITDLKISCLTSGITIEKSAPARIPDLFDGRTADCLFKLVYKKENSSAQPKFRIEGKLANGTEFSEEVIAQKVDVEGVSRLWAREYIKELEDQFRIGPDQNATKQSIVDISLAFSVLTKFTAFVAVDDTEVVNLTGQVRQVMQPVHMPDQWSMQSGAPATGQWAAQASPAGFGSAAKSRLRSMHSVNDSELDQQFNQVSAEQGAKFGYGGSSMWGAADASWSARVAQRSSAPPPGMTPAPTPARRAESRSDLPRSTGSGLSSTSSSSAGSSPFGTLKQFFKSMNLGGSSAPSTAPVSRIVHALRIFREEWMSAWAELANGRKPDSTIISGSREELMEALADHPVGFDVPVLQKFLRSSAKEFVLALQVSDLSSAEIYDQRARFHQGFVDSMVEAEDALLKLQGRQGAFWESTV
ncbi:MAG: VIT and VWA domain-containing protein [Candidatus Obscuribacterales bacterium]|nr:VIT and VWA domain-containing protein [Candidatus Obscuribacterales bacterium]